MFVGYFNQVEEHLRKMVACLGIRVLANSHENDRDEFLKSANAKITVSKRMKMQLTELHAYFASIKKDSRNNMW